MFPIFKPRYNHINLGLTHKLKRNIHRIPKTSTVYALNNYVKNYPRTGSPPKKGRWTPPPTFLMGYGTFTLASSSRIKILLLYSSGGANMHPPSNTRLRTSSHESNLKTLSRSVQRFMMTYRSVFWIFLATTCQTVVDVRSVSPVFTLAVTHFLSISDNQHQ